MLEALLSLSVLTVADQRDHPHSLAERERVIPNETGDSLTHVIDLRHLHQHRNKVEEGAVVRVIVPRDDREATFRLKHVGSWRIVNDNCVFHVATELSHVLYEDAVDEGAVLTEEASRGVALRVHHVHQLVRIL